jgi:Ca2+-binding RTX toxin-like protein
MTIGLAIALACATLPACALGSTVTLVPGDEDAPSTLRYEAAGGEANKVKIAVTGATATIDDPGATITAQAGCTASQNGKKATCTLQGPASKIELVIANLKDGGDTFEVSGAPSIADGGPGGDTLTGGEASDQLNGGGGGSDDMRGNAGPDSLADGDAPNAPASDDFDGGDGIDQIRYDSRTAAVIVDLANQPGQGQAGENDKIAAVENVVGGSGNDALSGDAGPNILGGGQGDDVIDGRGGVDRLDGGSQAPGGNDKLIGGAGLDDLEAGPGDDTLDLQNPPGDRDRLLGCGRGSDLIVGLGPAPSVAIDCERADYGFGFVTGLKPKSVTKTSVTLKIPCPAAFKNADGVCKGSIVVEPKSAYAKDAATRKKQRYGVKKFSISKSSGKVKIALNSAGRKQLAKSAFKLQFTVNLKETATKTKRSFAWTSYLVRSFL